jgi:multiple sugar transport system permease protein
MLPPADAKGLDGKETTLAIARPDRPRRTPRLSERVTGALLVLPALVLLLTLTLYPVVYGAWISTFNKHSFFPEQTFVGMSNYAYVLTDAEFWVSVRLGAIYALSSIVLQIVLGVAAALVVNERFPGRNLVRSILIFPYVIPTVLAVILWKWLLDSQFGLVNYLLEDAGIIDRPISWMGKDWIMVSLILVSVWQFFPFVVLGVLARLQSIPGELYEAAAIDGANAAQRFVHITLPQLQAVLFIVILLRSIWMFTKFDTPWLMILGGGAETYIRTLPVYTYQRTFAYYEAGIGATMAVLMFLMLAVIATVYFRLFRREEAL